MYICTYVQAGYREGCPPSVYTRHILYLNSASSLVSKKTLNDQINIHSSHPQSESADVLPGSVGHNQISMTHDWAMYPSVSDPVNSGGLAA